MANQNSIRGAIRSICGGVTDVVDTATSVLESGKTLGGWANDYLDEQRSAYNEHKEDRAFNRAADIYTARIAKQEELASARKREKKLTEIAELKDGNLVFVPNANK